MREAAGGTVVAGGEDPLLPNDDGANRTPFACGTRCHEVADLHKVGVPARALNHGFDYGRASGNLRPMPDIQFDRYYRYKELTALLQAYEKEFSELVKLTSIGK